MKILFHGRKNFIFVYIENKIFIRRKRIIPKLLHIYLLNFSILDA